MMRPHPRLVLIAGLPLIWLTAPHATAQSSTAAPVLSGHITAGTSYSPECMQDACQAFFAAGCPAALTGTDGPSASIINVTQHAGRTLTFSWEDSTTRAMQANGVKWWGSGIYFWLTNGCTKPTWMALHLTTWPGEQSATLTIPAGTTWLVAEGFPTARDIIWQAL